MRVTFALRPVLATFLVGWTALGVTPVVPALSADEPAEANDAAGLAETIDEELERQRTNAERFLAVLERNPRRGTALDKIYGFHLEAGSLESFAETLRKSAEQENDGARWMILGLVESQRGRAAEAIEALEQAAKLRPNDALAPFYLGQAQESAGRQDEAVAAFQEAIDRKPTATDSLEIFQALGRVHQRAGRTDEALAVWKRLEEAFPGDLRVQERIAATLAEEGELEPALLRYEALAKATADDYRRVAFQIEAANLKVKLKRAAEGIADLEGVLATLNPESWLFREVRRKIEEVFLRSEDRDGLAKYYEGWLARHPDDVDAMSRLAKSLTAQARLRESRERLDQALKLAPSRADLRQTLIALLVELGDIGAALDQYAILDELSPGDPDQLRAWGKLHLRDESRTKAERERAAANVWRRIADGQPDDPLLAAQTADLFRQAEMTEEALAHYERAVELAPTSPQYREYLGEYLHLLGRREQALDAWRTIAEGDLRTAENLTRLGEVLARFGYLNEALPELSAACELDPKNYPLRLAAADLFERAEAFDEALSSLDAAEALAETVEERESVLSRRIRTLQSAGRLEAVAEQLALSAGADASPETWLQLARYRQALGNLAEASEAVEKALAQTPRDVRALDAAARIAEASGSLEKAANLNRQLAAIDRRGQTEYLERIASLEIQLGRGDAALAAGRELIAAAPGNEEAYRFFAELCARLDRPDEGIEALRHAVRVNPNEPNLWLSLAEALADRFRTDEAIEIYWIADERSGSLDDRLLVIGKQADLYLQTNRFDELLERLERGRTDPETRREATICLAQAYQSAGDPGMARQELESLLDENSRDTQLLMQLSKLAESESDLAGAIAFQERLAEIAPGPETEYRLATLLSQSGEDETSSEILVRLSIAEEDRSKLLRNVDRLLATNQTETALRIVQGKLRGDPRDWELLIREGVALTALDRSDEAAEAFRAILSLSLPPDTKGTSGQPATTAPSVSRSAPSDLFYEGFLRETQELARLSTELGLNPRYTGRSLSVQSFTGPVQFGAARASALARLYVIARKEGKEQEYVAALGERAKTAGASDEALLDWYRLQAVLHNQPDAREAARLLVERGSSFGRFALLSRLRDQHLTTLVPFGTPSAELVAPLSKEDLDQAIRCYEALDESDGDGAPPAHLTSPLVVELDRADRSDEADAIVERIFQAVSSPGDAANVLTAALARKQPGDVRKYFERFAQLDLAARRQRSGSPVFPETLSETFARSSLGTDETFELFDAYLDWQSASSALDRERSRSNAGASTSTTPLNYQYWSNGIPQVARNEVVLAPTNRFPARTIVALRNLYERARSEERLEDFETRLTKIADDPDAAARDVRLFAVAYVARWEGDDAGTSEALERSVEAAPQDADLRLAAARHRAAQGELQEALILLDGFSPTDPRAVQDRELLALDLAVRIGDSERATAAARRLFGMRLGSQERIALVSQMRRLGMNEEADASLARAQRQSGGRISTLAALMAQYQEQGDDDKAAEVAFRILQRSRPVRSSSNSPPSPDEPHRAAAVRALKATGRLDAAIAAIEEQIARAPRATQLYERLVEYVRAKGDPEREFELQQKLCELQPKDARVWADFARLAMNRSKNPEACDAYIKAIDLDPSVLERDYQVAVRLFESADRMTDLATACQRLDLSRLQQPHYISQLVGKFLSRPATRTAGISLLKRAAKEQPGYVTFLWSSIERSDAWAEPELLEFGIDSALLQNDVHTADPWAPFSNSASVGSEGLITLPFTSLVESIRRKGRTEELLRRLDEAIAKRPGWPGGKALKLWIEFPTLDAEVAADRTRELFGDREGPLQRGEFYARWAIAYELGEKPAAKAFAADMMAALGNDASNTGYGFPHSPRAAAVELYNELGRRDDAIRVLREAIPQRSPGVGSDPYERSRFANELLNLGRYLSKADEPVEAVGLYAWLLSEPSLSSPDVLRYFGSEPDRLRSEATKGLELAMSAAAAKGFSGDAFAAMLERGDSTASESTLLLLERKENASGPARLASPLLELLSKVPEGEAETLAASLTEASADRPEALTVAVAATLLSLRELNAPRAKEALDRLVRTIDRMPLDPLPAGRRPSAKQRSQAMPQVALWFVARQAYGRPEFRDAARRLADRSVGAASRLTEPRFLQAILLERGAVAHDAGDDADLIWSDLLDRLFPPREAGDDALVPPATTSQFETAAALAVQASDRGFPRLSFDALRRSLAGGMPVSDVPTDSAVTAFLRAVPRPVARTGRIVEEDPTAKLVADGIREASLAWRRNEAPGDEASLALEAIVFPSSHPREVRFLSSHGESFVQRPQSLAAELAYWAAAAGRDAEVAREAAIRSDAPDSETASLALLAMIAFERKEASLLVERLDSLAERWDQFSAQERGVFAQVSTDPLDQVDFADVTIGLAETMGVRLADARAQRTPNTLPAALEDLDFELIALRARRGDAAGASKLAEQFQEARRRRLVRNGDRGLALLRKYQAQYALAVAIAGNAETTLASLGLYLDSAQPNEPLGPVDATPAFELLQMQLVTLAPERRYELLRDWTLPAPGRATLRADIVRQPLDSTPVEFRAEGESKPTKYGMLSTFEWLVDAAKEAGRLDELRELVLPLAGEGRGDADLLLLLIEVEADENAAKAKLAALIDEAKRRPDERTQVEAPDAIRSAERQRLEALAAAKALARPSLADEATTLLEELVPEYDRRNEHELRVFATKRLARRYAERAGGDAEALFRSPGLAYWHAESGAGVAEGPAAPLFVAHDGVVAHLAGDGQDRLFFRYPLGGEFRVSYKSEVGWAKQAELGFGGTVCESRPWEKCVYVYDATHGESLRRPEIPSLWEMGWDRTEVRISPESIKWFVNGQLAFEDSNPSAASPWLYLSVIGERRTRIRDLRIEGDPQILPEAPLIVGNSLDGWQSLDGRQTTTRLFTAESKRLAAEFPGSPAPRLVPQPGEWSAVDGTLVSVTDPQKSRPNANLLAYFRPLQTGESVSYEFYYEPDVAIVHPTLGRTAFILSDEEVTLRLATPPGPRTAQSPGRVTKAEASAEAYRRGPKRLPLRPDEWNRAELRMEQGALVLLLNDEPILEKPVTLAEDRRFGLFRAGQNDEVRVRNVMLRGDWPAAFPEEALQDPLALSEDVSREVRLARHAAIGEATYLEDAYDVYRRSRELSPETRYEFLAEWVLPNDDHPTLRTATSKTPLDPASLEEVSPEDDAPSKRSGGRRSHAGGEIVAPALELVRAAKELDRLDELEAEMERLSASPDPAIDDRAVEAMRLAIDLANHRFDSAAERLQKLRETAAEVRPEARTVERGPDLLALAAALERPETLEEARATAAWLVEKSSAPGTFGEWSQFIRREWAVARATNDPASGGVGESAPATLLHWQPVALPTARTRADGRPASKWRVTDGQVEYLGGNADDSLYFSTPLAGEFDVVCEVENGDYREMRLFYDGASLALQRGGADVRFAPHGRGYQDVPTNKKLELGEWVELRLSVRGQEMILFANGQEVFRSPVSGARPDPWFAFMTKLAFTHGAARNFRIEGTPTIPREVELFAGSQLVGGAAVYFEESVGSSPSAIWRGIDGEIRAEQLKNAPGRFAESVLRYHRPMLEDGEIEYEFYWSAGETEVHPALDRFVFVLRPEGVAAHAMTDGKWDRTGAKPNEIVALPNAVPVTLNENAWNKARLVIKGDVATLFVNDKKVAERTLPPTNQRTFGLFRWADRSGVRVRNVVHRGDWPEALPPAEERSFLLAPTP